MKNESITTCREGTQAGRTCTRRAVLNITMEDCYGEIATIPVCRAHGVRIFKNHQRNVLKAWKITQGRV